MFFDRVASSPLFRRSDHGLHAARFARPYELAPLISHTLTDNEALLLGVWNGNRPISVRPTLSRSELGNLAAVARTRGGKGLLAKAQILSWSSSLIVNDIKGELYEETAGFKSTMSRVFVFDTRGIGNRFDPLHGRESEDELRAMAEYLLAEPHEGHGLIFTKRAVKMLTQLFKAARIEGHPPLSYAGHFIHLGITDAARRLEELSIRENLPPKDNLATRFLDVAFSDADFESRFLQDAWSTLTGKIEPVITETILKSLAGADFSPADIISGERPVTLYLRWPEKHVHALAPLIRLVWSSLIDGLCAAFDERRGRGCRKVLALLDEAGRAPIAGLPEYAATVAGRHISLWLAYQSRSQPAAIYGDKRAEILWDNMESIVFYRPATGNRSTGKYLEDSLGERSGFARSETEHEGERASESKSERAIPLLTAWDIQRMGDTDIIGFHRDIPPFRAKRMNYRNFPELVGRSKIAPPQVSRLPDVADIPDLTGQSEGELSEFFDPDGV